ncbi:MAG: HAMP domain-containing histidine kinase [Pyrinomonadaceae bacterium]|nr:HAMP domain-containing histidine kinase [Phycisphaerales bacterium]
MLGLTVLGSLSAAIWTFIIQHRALTGPFESTPLVLDSLQDIRQNLLLQTSAIRCLENPAQFLVEVQDPVAPSGRLAHVPSTPPIDPSDDASMLQLAERIFKALSAETSVDLRLLTESELYIAGGSQSALKILDSRLRDFDSAASAWFLLQDNSTKAVLLQAASETSGLIEKIERRLLEDRGRGVDFSNGIVGKLVRVLFYAALASVLVGTLAVMLVRRWVVRPVQNLRVAAVHIAKGHFEHQIPVRGQDEIAQLSSEVNSMASMIQHMLDERIDRERLAAVGEMVQRLAHNLRSPLAGIRGVAELTRDELPPGSDLKENQQRILVAVDRLEKWMADLLSATKPLHIHTEPVDPRKLLVMVIDSHRAMAFAKGISLESDIQAAPPLVILDPLQMEHALVSILSNGIQATPAGTRIRLYAGLSQRAGFWEVRVSDQGPGVPSELMEKIFRPYFTTKRDGNGIGLAVASQVIKAHGGQIDIETGLGSSQTTGSGPGATFIVTLPIHPVSLHSASSSNVPSSPTGAAIAQDPGHRGRGEPAVLNPSNAQ